jgi:uncharacterized protein (TIGR02453 family)
METRIILDFLNALKENNNRDWFQEHKKDYEEAKTEMLQVIHNLINEISSFDATIGQLEAKQCLFRIYRDVRFSKNKEPYKTNMGAYMVRGGRKSGNAGYYLHLEPGNSFIGGGIHKPDPKQLKAIRNEIAYAGDDLVSITESKNFKHYFSEIEGDSLVRPPKGFDPESKYIDLLKLKSFTVFQPLDDSVLLADDFSDQITPVFKAMQPFLGFINAAFKI